MNDILIVGTGALATLFAARLSESGRRVAMLGTWKEGLNALREKGARLIDTNGIERAFKVHATDDPSECLGTKYALVLVKAWQTERAAQQLQQCLAEDGIAVTLQNGIGNREILARHLGSKRVALGTTTTGATLLGAGVAKIGGEGMISLERNPSLGPIEAALRSANFNVQVVENAASLVWGKLVINAAINPLTALLRIPNGELLKHESTRELMAALATETAQAARAEKIELPFPDPIVAVEEVARKTAANRSSMLQDVLRGAPTEIDAICGAVVQIAQKHGRSAPVNWTCWQLVRALALSKT
ncbi:MAG TPA: 2-dehydropantoate 2-reductase [Anaerolineales bacterium]|nr:2-dehydropantoate 2-reductase [Anaerolineales bacterium]